MDLQETIEFTRIVNRLATLYPRLMPMAATEAVNFFKERFVAQNWIGNTTESWKKRKSKKDADRAVGTKTGALRRDIHKIEVNENRAIIGTSRITKGYAKAFNEGFKGTVTVKAHTRARYKHVTETYKTRRGNTRTRTSKQVDSAAGAIQVGTHRRKMNMPARPFLGQSPFLDKRIQRMVAAQIIQTITTR